MSEFVLDSYEELRPLGEVMEDLRERAGEMLGRIGVRMGFEMNIAYSTEDKPDNDSSDDGTAKMADEKKQPEVEVKDEARTKPDGTTVTVHTESLKPGSAGPGTGAGGTVPKGKK